MQIHLQVLDAVAASLPGSAAAPQAGAQHAADVRSFGGMMSGGGNVDAIGGYLHGVSAKFESWRDGWMNIGDQVDLNSNATAVRMLEQQARLSSQGVELQFALQAADSVRGAFKTLTQQQA